MGDDSKKVEFKTFTNLKLKDAEEELAMLREGNSDSLYLADHASVAKAMDRSQRRRDEDEVKRFRYKASAREEKTLLHVGVKTKRDENINNSKKDLQSTVVMIRRKKTKADPVESTLTNVSNVEAAEKKTSIASLFSLYKDDEEEDNESDS